MSGIAIETDRLRLRSWRSADLAPFHAICSDPRVMATLGPVMTLAQTEALIERVSLHEHDHGYTFWAVERREDSRLIGWCGIIRGDAGPVANKAEIGWRLASDCWGHGYASEAARGTLDWLFANLPDDAAWAITSVENVRSRSVMQRLGMIHQPRLDFDHPRIAEGDPLRRHVAYCLSRHRWNAV